MVSDWTVREYADVWCEKGLQVWDMCSVGHKVALEQMERDGSRGCVDSVKLEPARVWVKVWVTDSLTQLTKCVRLGIGCSFTHVKIHHALTQL